LIGRKFPTRLWIISKILNLKLLKLHRCKINRSEEFS
jgi:hypothetical protein